MKSTNPKWTLFWPHVPERQRLLGELENTFNSRWIGQGPKVKTFESAFARRFDSSHAVAVSSGTAALHLSYCLAGIGEGDTVISAVLTCTATHHALLQQKAHIIFADVEPNTLTIDPNHVRELLAKFPAKAIVGVHLGGIPCDISKLSSIAKESDAMLIFDAAQALGSQYMHRPICSGSNCGFATAYSFQAIKHITTGDGGMLCLPEDGDADRARRLRWFGIDREAREKDYNWQPWLNRSITVNQSELGYKYQMTDVAACLGLCGLEEVDWVLDHRAVLANNYERKLKGLDGVTLFDYDKKARQSSHSLFCLLIDRRDDFCRALSNRGVETNIVQLRNDIYDVFGGTRQSLPNMNEVEDKYVYLPLHTNLSIEDVEMICEEVRKGW